MREATTPAMQWTGRILSGLVVLALLADAGVNLFAPQVMRDTMNASQLPLELGTLFGSIMLVCAILYAIPRTAVLGAILTTGFLGGAILTHVRLGETLTPPILICIALGVMAWGGLYLRDARLRALLPFSS